MQTIFFISILLFLLCFLTAGAAGRRSSRYSHVASNITFIGGWVLLAGVLMARHIGESELTLSYLDGALAAVLFFGAVYLMSGRWMPSVLTPPLLALMCLIVCLLIYLKSLSGDTSYVLHTSGLGVHIVFSYLSFAAFSVAAALSLFFILQERMIRSKKLGRLFVNLPPLEFTNRMGFAFFSVAAATLIVAAWSGIFKITGMNPGWHVFWEPTILGSFFVLLLYMISLLIRNRQQEHGRKFALWTLFTYGIVLLVFMSQHQISGAQIT